MSFPSLQRTGRSFQNLYPGFPRRISIPFPTLLRKDFPRLCKPSASDLPGHHLPSLFLFPPPAVIFLAAQSFPSARRFKPRCALFPFAFACPIRGHAPLTLFGFFRICAFHSLSNPPVRFPFGFTRCLLSFRTVLGGRVRLVPLFRPHSPLRAWFRFSFLHGFPPFQTQAIRFLPRQTFLGCLSFAFRLFRRPCPGFSRRFPPFPCTKKGPALGRPLFFYIKNFPMYP